MSSVLLSLITAARRTMRTRAALQLEILALRHQLQVLQRSRPRRVRLTACDRLLWVWLSRVWQEWRSSLMIVRPERQSLAGIGAGFDSSGRGSAGIGLVDPRFPERFAR